MVIIYYTIWVNQKQEIAMNARRHYRKVHIVYHLLSPNIIWTIILSSLQIERFILIRTYIDKDPRIRYISFWVINCIVSLSGFSYIQIRRLIQFLHISIKTPRIRYISFWAISPFTTRKVFLGIMFPKLFHKN